MANQILPYISVEGIAEYSSKISALAKNKKIFIICDQNTLQCVKYLQSNIKELSEAPIFKVGLGEENKTLIVSQKIWDFLLKNNATRSDLIVNVGGGMITDLGGFVASVYKRGISYLNIPTSLLGMIDASIGGKTGINYHHYKNQIGTFSNPKLVICDPHLLNSLPKKELLSGFAEALKHGLVFNEKYWQLCTSKPINQLPISEIITDSIKIKSHIVSIDPYEKKERKLLNLGHTIGHSLESLLLEKKTPTLHGFAVANGIVMESFIASEIKLLSRACFKIIKSSIYKIYQPISIDKNDIPLLLEFMKKDKKNSSKEINFTLIERIGKGKIDVNLSEGIVQEKLEKFISIG
ncbi:MAG: 3-dehydroquinate synthase [Flavobacteriales bacterium]|nr:3-dehydroquinate synthase [Flavobacteriales bacterium]